MSGHRRAAAALYTLAQSDQEGILSELAECDQRALRAHLAELAELGFDKAANMDLALEEPEAVTGELAAAPAPAPQTSSAAVAGAAERNDPRARLRGASACEMFAAVAQEPAGLIAQLLALETWPWAGELLLMLPTARSTQVQMATDAGMRAAPARERFLVDAISARLGERAAGMVGARFAHFLQVLGKWLPWIR